MTGTQCCRPDLLSGDRSAVNLHEHLHLRHLADVFIQSDSQQFIHTRQPARRDQSG